MGRGQIQMADLQKYLSQKDDLHAGRPPRESADGATVRELCNRFLTEKQQRVDVGELSPRTWTDYEDACDEIIASFGKLRRLDDLSPDDFAKLRNMLAKKNGPHRLGKTIQCIRCVFTYAFESSIIATPVRYGPGFKRPSKKTMRLHRAKQDAKFFTQEEIHKLMGAAGPQLRAMILHGVNCGFNNSDCGNLPLTVVNLEMGWIDYPRPKTGIPRRCPLWPETVAAIKEAINCRPEPEGPHRRRSCVHYEVWLRLGQGHRR